MVRLPPGRSRRIGGITLARAIVVGWAGTLLLRGGGDDQTPGGTPAAVSADQTPVPLGASALPGEGWVASETELVSLFDSPGAVFPATPDLAACAPVRAFEDVLFENEPAFSRGESQLFERPLADGGTVRVSLLTVTFSDASAVEAILASARSALGGPGFAACMIAAAARDGIEATAAEGAALPVPAGGVSRVLRYTAVAASGGGTVTQAVGWWGAGERLVALTVSAAGEGPDDAELARIAQAAVEGGR